MSCPSVSKGGGEAVRSPGRPGLAALTEWHLTALPLVRRWVGRRSWMGFPAPWFFLFFFAFALRLGCCRPPGRVASCSAGRSTCPSWRLAGWGTAAPSTARCSPTPSPRPSTRRSSALCAPHCRGRCTSTRRCGGGCSRRGGPRRRARLSCDRGTYVHGLVWGGVLAALGGCALWRLHGVAGGAAVG